MNLNQLYIGVCLLSVELKSLEVLYVFHLEGIYIKPKVDWTISGLHVLSIISLQACYFKFAFQSVSCANRHKYIYWMFGKYIIWWVLGWWKYISGCTSLFHSVRVLDLLKAVKVIFCWGQRKCNFAGLKCNHFWCIVRNANSHLCESALVTLETHSKNCECSPLLFFIAQS